MIKLFNFITNLFLHPAERVSDNEESKDKNYRIVFYEGKFYPQLKKKNGFWSNYVNLLTEGDYYCSTEEEALKVIMDEKERRRKLAIPNHIVGGYK